MRMEYLILCSFYLSIQCFWPPSYDINLHENITFVISEDQKDEDDKIVQDEDEMILNDELEKLQFNENSNKFAKLHQIAFRKRENIETFQVNTMKYHESNWDSEEMIPKEIGFVGENGTLEDLIPIYSFKNDAIRKRNHTANESIYDTKHVEMKRQYAESSLQDVEYNYDEMKARFDEDLAKEKTSENILNYKEVKEEETARDSLKTIWREKDEINCTIEEMKGIGARAFLCVLKEPDKNKASKFFARLGKICILWFIVYLIAAVPMWCTRGWCCCCFRCKFCRPRARIDGIKEYFTQNPPGVVHDDYDNIIEYQPTSYETYYQKQLEKELRKLISY
ncbi:hypothetical protein HHI36_001590 [Cryptolaemus montrouzieri]|uniref:Uncharacterized protein n=1 Tax=Cryptolaemus montrouzieri TaxID=559131 RepID=A0ABD2P8E0_9CUCU